jgi:hypothetical protein
MAKALPDIAIEVRDVSEEICALREAVEVLEDMYGLAQESRAYWISSYTDMARQLRDERGIAGAQRAECERLAAQNAELAVRANKTSLIESLRREIATLTDALTATRTLNVTQAVTIRDLQGARDDYAARLKAVNNESIRANRAETIARINFDLSEDNARKAAKAEAQLREAEGQLARMRGVTDETGNCILGLVADGYSVDVRPDVVTRGAMITVRKDEGDVRHSASYVLQDPSVFAPSLPYAIKRAYRKLVSSMRSGASFATGGVVEPQYYARKRS